MQMQGGKTMLKRYLGILKRNKKEFSNKELKWQSEKSEKMLDALLIFEVQISTITCGLLILGGSLWNYQIIRIFTVGMGLSIVVFLAIIYFSLVRKEACSQLEKNLEKKKEKILSYIANGELSKLKLINEALQQEVFQKSTDEIVRIKSVVGYVEVTIKNGRSELIPKSEALLDTFDIIDE